MGQRGAFILGQVYNKQVTLTHPVAVSTASQSTGYDNAWDVNPGTYGWIGGSNAPQSSVERIDFSNDSSTAIVRSPLATARGFHAAAGNATYGWHIAGGPSAISSVDRIEYSNDLSIALTRGPLPVAKLLINASGNANYAWAAGGSVATSQVSRIEYANDSVLANPRGNLIATRYRGGATGNQLFGWYAGGNSTAISRVDRIEYANDLSTSLTRGSLSANTNSLAATSNLGYGWFSGGYTGAVPMSTVNRIDFSNDTGTTSIRGTLSVARNYLSGAGNVNYGWYIGGGASAVIDRIDYSSDTSTAAIRGPLSANRVGGAATSNYVTPHTYVNPPNSDTQSGGFGWWIAGKTPFGGDVTHINRIDFTNDTVALSNRGTITVTKSGSAATGNANYGWSSSGNNTFVDRIDYSNDTGTTPIKGSTLQTVASAGAGNVNYGWIAGGQLLSSSVQRIDYANDNALASNRGAALLPVGRFFLTGVSTPNFGWFGGGQTFAPAVVTIVDRLVFSNDTVAMITRGSLLIARDRVGASSNLNYGWYAGGVFPSGVSSVDRIDFSNDSVTAISRGNLSQARSAIGGMGNAVYGWFGGGYTFPVYSSTVDRITYSNDTAAAVARGSLSEVKSYVGAVSNYVKEIPFRLAGTAIDGTKGWSMGGSTPTASLGSTTIERIDFSNDLLTANVRSPLLVARYENVGLANGNYGWTMGGGIASPNTSTIERLDFSTDTAANVLTASLTNALQGAAGVSTRNFGWIGSGSTPAFSSSITRYTFSTDMNAPLSRSVLSSARYRGGAVGNISYGYWGGGAAGAPPHQSVVNRLDFSNDQTAAATRGPLSVARTHICGGTLSNPNYGWWAGGYQGGIYYSLIERTDFSNDSATAVARGSASNPARVDSMGAGNADFGWLIAGAGDFFLDISSIDRVTYSNDTVTASARGRLNATKFRGAGISNYLQGAFNTIVSQYNKGTTAVGTGEGSYSWLAGGNPATVTPVSTIDRIDVSNDLVTAAVRGPLLTSRGNLNGAGLNTANFGWIAGGGGPSLSFYNTTEKINFANDTVATIDVGLFSTYAPNTSRAGMQTVSSNSNGYITGGYDGITVVYSHVFRMTFSNDTGKVLDRGPLDLATTVGASAENLTFGWIVGGASNPFPTPAPARSSITRISFSNDTSVSIVRSALSVANRFLGGVSNNNYGWWAGGQTFTTFSTVERTDFSNDNATPVVRGPLSVAKYEFGATGNSSYGWFSGSWPGNSVVVRIDYSNDTSSSSTRGSLSTARAEMGALSNYTK